MTLSNLINSVAIMDQVTEKYFWQFVDAGTQPEQTPLADKSRHKALALEISVTHGLNFIQAQHLVFIAQGSVV